MTRRKKNDQKPPVDPISKKIGKNEILVRIGLDPTAFLKGPWGCPLDHR
jgi:hypothetical protein